MQVQALSNAFAPLPRCTDVYNCLSMCALVMLCQRLVCRTLATPFSLSRCDYETVCLSRGRWHKEPCFAQGGSCRSVSPAITIAHCSATLQASTVVLHLQVTPSLAPRCNMMSFRGPRTDIGAVQRSTSKTGRALAVASATSPAYSNAAQVWAILTHMCTVATVQLLEP